MPASDHDDQSPASLHRLHCDRLVARDTDAATDRRIIEVLAGDPRTWTTLGIVDSVGEFGDITILDDADGALTIAVLGAFDGPVRVRCTSLRANRQVAESVDQALPEEVWRRLTVAGVNGPTDVDDMFPIRSAPSTPSLVLWRLPKSLRELDRGASLAARHRAALVAGGHVKHMTPSMNGVLGNHFGTVHASLAQQKARCLVAGDAAPEGPEQDAGNPVTVAGHEVTLHGIGGVFNGNQPDHGSELLLTALRDHGPAQVTRAHDLGSGNGLLTAWLARQHPTAAISASDDSLDAVDSTCATLRASGLAGALDEGRIKVTWQDQLTDEADESYDLVALNPPFHQGAGVDASQARELIAAAARVLRPAGELWLVHNSHLRYRTDLDRLVGDPVQVTRDRRFTVLRAARR